MLTKPDAVNSEVLLDAWRKRLTGEIPTRLLQTHGFYVTRQPGPDEPKDITFDDARKKEKQFFQQSRWTSLSADIRDRLGTDNLSLALSRKLSDYILEL